MSDAGGTPARGTRKWPLIGLVLGVLWLFVRGVPLAPRAVLGELLVGLLVGVPLAFLSRRLYTDRVAVLRAVRAVPWAMRYVLTFLFVLVTANVDVAYRVLAPSMPIDPDVIAIPLRVEGAAAVTTIANSITLTPGTLTMDHDPETNTLYVHSIAVQDVRSVVAPIRTLEDYALHIFDEDVSAAEPPRAAHTVEDPDAGGDWGERDAG